MNTSEKVSSASPSPTYNDRYATNKPRKRMPRSRSMSLPSPKQRTRRSRSRSRENRRRLSPPSYSYQRSIELERVEEFTSICIKNLNENIDMDHLYDSIYSEFKRYKNFTIKIALNKKAPSVNSHFRTERIAFVNFYSHETASAAKRDKNHKILCGHPMYIEPVYKNYKPGAIPPPPPHYTDRRSPVRVYRSARRSRSRSISPAFYRPKSREFESRGPELRRYEPRVEQNYYKREDRMPRRRTPSPLPQNLSRARTPPLPPRLKYDDLAYGLSRSRSRSPRASRPNNPPQTHYYDNDEKDQTRTLFIGNLDADVDRDYLWKQFEKYGIVEEIDVKKSAAQQPYDHVNKKTYAFVRYENMDMAKEAKMAMNGKRIGQNEIKIGYGKVQATNCLWIGGINEKVQIKDLEKEIKYILNTNDTSKFDILYKKPNIFAYVLFYNVKHAEQVRFDIRGKNLPNSDKLRVDYHDPKIFNLIKPNIKSKSRSPSPINKRRIVQEIDAKTAENEDESKNKKSKISNGNDRDSKQNYENIIITKIDNIRRVDTIEPKNKSPSPEIKPITPSENSKSKENEPKVNKDEGELWDDEVKEPPKPTRQVIKEACFNDFVFLSRSIQTKSFRNLKDLKESLEPYWSWNGLFTLKKNSFPINFYLLAGNKQLSESLLPSNNKDMNFQINQRIRLDSSKMEDIEKKLSDKVNEEWPTYSVFICLAADLVKKDRVVQQKRSLHNLVTYLNQKSAAGLVSLPDDNRNQANLNIFTSASNLALKLIKQLLPNLKLDQSNEEDSNYLICILLKSPNSSLD